MGGLIPLRCCNMMVHAWFTAKAMVGEQQVPHRLRVPDTPGMCQLPSMGYKTPYSGPSGVISERARALMLVACLTRRCPHLCCNMCRFPGCACKKPEVSWLAAPIANQELV